MRTKRNSCKCGKAQKPKQTTDKFKSIICENCYEVLSYESGKKLKQKKLEL
jgi:hypothetical protein